MKAKLRGTSKYNQDFKECKVVLPISVGKEPHEGDKFLATLNLISRRFKHCDIVLADSLQRFNFINEADDKEEAAKHARLQGDLWLKRNGHSINVLSIPHKLIRWDDCIQWPTFSKWLKNVKQEYAVNPAYQQAFSADIVQFLSRKKLKINDCLYELSLAYFLEEIAVILSYFVDQAYQFIIYPGRIPKSIEFSRGLFLAKAQSELMHDLGVYFRK
ncbi:MAG: Uncharacterized protein K0R66_1384 [Gammaproteobacteria bacterium]|jgi:tRNA-dependent cyclodipeptide synthase|nr:Uncharacterized protein [Gammaproteobacteria bacterium]